MCQFDHKELKGRAFGIGAGGFDAFGGDATDGHGHGTHCCELLFDRSHVVTNPSSCDCLWPQERQLFVASIVWHLI